jgi:hypothetical protein
VPRIHASGYQTVSTIVETREIEEVVKFLGAQQAMKVFLLNI